MENQFIWSSLLTIGLAACGWFITLGNKLLNEIQTNVAAQIEQHDEQLLAIAGKLDNHAQELNDFKLYAARTFVSKEDGVYYMEKIDSKLGKLSEQMHKIDKDITRIATIQEVETDEQC